MRRLLLLLLLVGNTFWTSFADSDYSAEIPGDPDGIPHPETRPPTLSLGCSLCKQVAYRTARTLKNLTQIHSPALKSSLNDEYCNKLGIFRVTCMRVVDKHLLNIIEVLVSANLKVDGVCTAKSVGLCPTADMPIFCNTYYLDGGDDPNNILGPFKPMIGKLEL